MSAWAAIADMSQCTNACPLYPRKRTCAVQLGMSALCQKQTLRGLVGLSGKGQKGTFQETALYNPSTMNARDFVDLIRMAVISFVF